MIPTISLLENSFNHAPVGIAMVSLTGRFVRVNVEFCRMLGYTEQQLLSMSASEVTFPLDLNISEHYKREILEGAIRSCSYEQRYIRRTGETLWGAMKLNLVCDEQGSPQYFLAYLTDISDRKQVEEQVYEARMMYSLLAQHSEDMIFLSSVNGEFLFVSPAVSHLLGYEPEELTSGRMNPDEREWLKSAIAGNLNKFVHRVRHRRGHYVWFETTLKKYFDESQDSLGILGISRDITDRHHVEQALRKSESNLALAQRIASIGSWEWDAEEQEVVWSDEMYRIFQTDASKVIAKLEHLVPFIHPDDRPLLQHNLAKSLEQGEFQCECRALQPEGTVKYVHIQGIVSLNGEGRPVKMHGTVQDVTSRKLMMLMLEDSVDRHTSLKKYNLDAVVSINLDGIITSVNPSAEKISGFTADQLVGLHYSALITPLEEIGRVHRLFQLLMSGKMTDSAEISIRHQRGHEVYLLATPAPIYVNKQLVGCYIMAKDISEQKRKDELLRKSEKLSIAGQLAAGIAHEIRNPLTAIKGFVQLMGHSSQYADKYLPIMREELERIELIVSELLMLAKPQAGTTSETNLLVLLRDVVTLLEAQANLQGVELTISPDSRPFSLHCDGNQIKQVFINFLKNAMEAMPQGGVVQIDVRSKNGRSAEIRVSDQGVGIPEEWLRQIGEPFFTTKESGTGLGFMISQKIIENHGGKVGIESRVGHGTTITVTLPFDPGESV